MHRIAYPNSTDGDLIRRLLVDIAAWQWEPKYLKGQDNDPAWSNFYLDLAVVLSTIRAADDKSLRPAFETDSCVYHEHRPNDMPCYKTKLRM